MAFITMGGFSFSGPPIDALDWQESVLDRFDPVAATPAGPTTGDRYISTTTNNGWTTNYIYEWSGTVWIETVPNEGFITWVEDENVHYLFDGAAWAQFVLAPINATYITQTPNGTLTNEQAMSALATGIVKNATTTGVQSIAIEGTDYYGPAGTDVAITDGGTGASTAQAAIDALSAVAGATNEHVLTKDTGTGNAVYKVIDHDALTNYVAGEHLAVGAIDHDSLLNYVAGEHLAVGAIDHDSLLNYVAGEHLAVGAIDHDSLLNYVAGEHFTQAAITTVGTVTVGDVDAVVSAASDTVAGKIEIATIAETNTGTDATRAVSPDGLDGWTGSAQVTTVGTLSAGNVTSQVSAATDALAGKAELATIAETNTGTDATRTVTPDGLAGSNLGTKSACIVVHESDDAVAIADGKIAFTIPASMNGMNLTNVVASVHTKGITNTTDIQLRRRRAGADVDMLTVKITIGDEFFATDETIDGTKDDVLTGDQIYVDVDAIHSGTAPDGLSVTMEFMLP